MKKTLSIVLTLVMILSSLSMLSISSVASSLFSDVNESDWYYEAVMYGVNNGYFDPFDSQYFRPLDSLERQDFALYLAKISGADLYAYNNVSSYYTDVHVGSYYYAAVNWAVSNSVITGYSNGKFGVGDRITREQVATILYRYVGSPEVNNVDSTLAMFPDQSRISSYARTALAWAVQNGVISGNVDGTVAPTDKVSRAEIATIFMRMHRCGMFEQHTQSSAVVSQNGLWKYVVLNQTTVSIQSDGFQSAYLGNEAVVTVPSMIDGYNVTTIGSCAFLNCDFIENIIIPNSITTIKGGAFFNCSSLADITIPDSVTSIGSSAFKFCTSLTEILLPESITDIGYNVFGGCSSLINVTVDENNNSLSSQNGILFNKDMTAIKLYPEGKATNSYTIPDGVTSVESFAFHNNSHLTAVIIPNSVTSIGNNAFDYCTSLESITIPDSVTSIGSYAFSNCTSLESITIPDSVTSIGGYAFSDCTSLESITIPDSVTSIGSYAFSDCTSLESITIPDSVTSIGSYAFSNCTSLTSLTIPNSVTSIGTNAFSGITTSLTLYVGIGSCAESYAIANNIQYIHTIILNYSVKQDGTIEIVKNTVVPDELVIPSTIDGYTVTSIGKGAFTRMTNLTEVTLPDTVTEIGNGAFYNCYNLETVNIPEGVTRIGRSAFFGCESLGNIYIPASVTEIIPDAFYGCYNIDVITGYLDTAADDYAAANGFDFHYLDVIESGDLNGDGQINSTDYMLVRNGIEGLGLNHYQSIAGDVISDGAVDAFDLFQIDKSINNLA